MSSKTHILYIIKEYNVLVLKKFGDKKRQVEEDFKCKKNILLPLSEQQQLVL
ncbi:hypothetical protein BN1318_530010 [Staphylococcus capitis]|nr:hypothetical protein BN1318_530010 [Staphylococcus capitis]